MRLEYQLDAVQLQEFINDSGRILAWKVFKRTKDGNLQSLNACGESAISYELNKNAPVIPLNPKAPIDERGYYCFTTREEAEAGYSMEGVVICLVVILPNDIVAFSTTCWVDGSTTHTIIVKTFMPILASVHVSI